MAAAPQTTPLVTIAPAPPGAAQLAAWQRLWTLLLASGPNTSDAMAISRQQDRKMRTPTRLPPRRR
jgi:hypothetical protein